jgi:hypothetical protein
MKSSGVSAFTDQTFRPVRILRRIGRSLRAADQACSMAATQDNAVRINALTSVSRVGFEATFPAYEREKTFRGPDRASIYQEKTTRDKIPKDVLDDGKAVRAIDRKQDLTVQNYA